MKIWELKLLRTKNLEIYGSGGRGISSIEPAAYGLDPLGPWILNYIE